VKSLRIVLLFMLLPALAVAQARGDKSLVVGVQDLRDTLDPAINLANAGFPLSNNLFDTLIRRDYAGNAEGTGAAFLPGLAESWKRLDETTLELTLRPGVVFHTGEPLSSQDVVFTFERILDPASKYAAARAQLGNIARVEALDERTVRVVTKRPDPVLIKMLAYPGAAIVSKRYFQQVGFDAFQSRPAGTGPYKLASFRPDDRVVLEAFDRHWAGAPPASRLTFRLIPEVAARITALANGEVDLINSVPPDQLAAIERLGCCEVRSVPVNSHVLNYRTAHPALRDKRLRQALNLAIDRDLLVKSLWLGQAEVLNGHQYAEWDNLYDPQRPKYAFDAERARKLIAESGYKGEPIILVTSPVYYTNGLASAEAVVAMWRKVGVNAQVKVDENWFATSAKDSSIAVRNVSDWLIVADPNATILWSWTITALWDGNAAFKALGEQASTTLDDGVRLQKYRQMLDMLEDEAPGTVLYRAREFYGVRKGIAWRPFTLYMMDFRAANLRFGN
jgi:peptide/nickel transport system substrate-binding protein